MEWYNIIIGIAGIFGGVGGIVSLYHAKSNKDTIDIQNMQKMLDSAAKLHDEITADRDSIKKEFKEYKEDNMKYVAEFKERFTKTEQRLDKVERDNLTLRRNILTAYRCPYPPDIKSCPVIKDYEYTHQKTLNS